MIKISKYSEEGLSELLSSYEESFLSLKLNIKSNQEMTYFKIIEANVSQLIHLIKLAIIIPSNCVLTEIGYHHLSNAIAKLSQLTDLTIEINQQCFLQNEGLILLRNGIINLSKLENLKISIKENNYISSDIGQQFIDSLKDLQNLRELDLYITSIQKSLREEGNIQFWRGIGHLQNIEKITLSINDSQFDEQDLQELLQGIVALKKLTCFSFSFLNDNQQIRLIDDLMCSVGQMVNLKSLRIEFQAEKVYLNETQRTDILNNLKNLKQIEQLSIQKIAEQLMKYNLKQYLETIGTLHNLKNFDFNYHGQYMKSKEQLNWFSSTFLCLKNITDFHLDFQYLQISLDEDFIHKLSNAFSQMSLLRSLDLQLNEMNKRSYNKLGELIGSLNNLITLKILSKSYKCEDTLLINNLRYLVQLKNLSFTVNFELNVSQIYSAIQELRNLKYLHLDVTNIYQQNDDLQLEQLNKMLKQLKQLKTLNLSLKICNLQEQKQLDLIENAFSYLQTLESLSLKFIIHQKNNQLHKMDLLKHLSGLKELQISFAYQVLNIFDQEVTESKIHCLENVYIRFTQSISTLEFVVMMDSLANFSNLKKLKLEPQIRSDYSNYQKMFTNVCSKFNNLVKLTVQFDNESRMAFFAKGIKKMKNLKSLSFESEYCIEMDEEAYFLGKQLQKLENLEKLSISALSADNEMRERTDREVEDQFRFLSKLRKTDLWFFVYRQLIMNQIISFDRLQGNDDEIFKDQSDQAEHFKMMQIVKPYQLVIDIIQDEDEQRMYILNNFKNINLEYLSDLSIQNKCFTTDYTYLAFNNFCKFDQLQRLRSFTIDIKNLLLTEEQIALFSLNVKYLVNLEILSIKMKKFLDYYSTLINEFKCLSQLQSLTLESSVTEQVAISLGQQLMVFQQLEFCSLIFQEESTFNKFGFLSIINGLKGLKRIQKLKLNLETKGQLIEENIDYRLTISDCFKQMSYLEELKLNIKINSMFQELKELEFFYPLNNLTHLNHLNIQLTEDNPFNQDQLDILFSAIRNLSDLRNVNILVSIENSNKAISISKNLSNWFNKYFEEDLIISTYENMLIISQGENKIKLQSQYIDNFDLDFLQEIQESVLVRFECKTKLVSRLKKLKISKVRASFGDIQNEGDLNDVCKFISVNKHVKKLAIQVTINQNIICDSLEKIAHEINQLKDLNFLYLVPKMITTYMEPVSFQLLRQLISILMSQQQLRECYVLTIDVGINSKLIHIILKSIKRMVMFTKENQKYKSYQSIYL